jgi:YD repeat-containing protein
VNRRIEINSGGVQYRNPSGVITKSITFQRDSQGRIIAIKDPRGIK